MVVDGPRLKSECLAEVFTNEGTCGWRGAEWGNAQSVVMLHARLATPSSFIDARLTGRQSTCGACSFPFRRALILRRNGPKISVFLRTLARLEPLLWTDPSLPLKHFEREEVRMHIGPADSLTLLLLSNDWSVPMQPVSWHLCYDMREISTSIEPGLSTSQVKNPAVM